MNSIQPSVFFQPTLPATRLWDRHAPRPRRPQPPVPVRFALDTDELASTKQEAICGGILALCLFYTFGYIMVQFAS